MCLYAMISLLFPHSCGIFKIPDCCVKMRKKIIKESRNLVLLLIWYLKDLSPLCVCQFLISAMWDLYEQCVVPNCKEKNVLYF